MSGYDLVEGYDYKAHWSKRDREEPRLGAGTMGEALAEMAHQVAAALARDTYKIFNDDDAVKAAFEHIVAREKYHICLENLYGFGDVVLSGDGDWIFDNLWKNMAEEYVKELRDWRGLHVQNESAFSGSRDEFYEKEKPYLDYLYGDRGFTDGDFEALQLKERARVEAYCASEDAWIRSSGGYRGD